MARSFLEGHVTLAAMTKAHPPTQLTNASPKPPHRVQDITHVLVHDTRPSSRKEGGSTGRVIFVFLVLEPEVDVAGVEDDLVQLVKVPSARLDDHGVVLDPRAPHGLLKLGLVSLNVFDATVLENEGSAFAQRCVHEDCDL